MIMSDRIRKMLLSLALLAGVLAQPLVVLAQDGSATSREAATSDDVEANAFEPLQTEFANLWESFRAIGGWEEKDRDLIVSLRDRIAAFRSDHPDHAAAIATELTLSDWLKDSDRVVELFQELTELEPDNLEMLLERANHLRRLGRYDAAITVLRSKPFDYDEMPLAGVTLAEALAAESRFEEACETLAKVSDEAINASPAAFVIRPLKTQLQQLCPSYVELWKAEQALREQEANASGEALLPQVLIITAKGNVIVELFEDQAPNHVANFISLVEKGFYDGTKFHRVEPGLIQGGDPNTKEGATGAAGQGGPGYRINAEHTRADHRKHFSGTLAMARSTDPNSAGSQFYICKSPAPQRNANYTVFGRVIEGLEIVRRIEKNDEIVSATVLRKRDHAYEPVTTPDPVAPAAGATPPAAGATPPVTGSTPPPSPPPAQADEPAPPADDPPADDPPADDPPADDPAGDDPAADDPAGDDPAADDEKPDEPSEAPPSRTPDVQPRDNPGRSS
jgi:cyclophilin family peptidyl-prolyl cis-trans isomerase